MSTTKKVIKHSAELPDWSKSKLKKPKFCKNKQRGEAQWWHFGCLNYEKNNNSGFLAEGFNEAITACQCSLLKRNVKNRPCSANSGSWFLMNNMKSHGWQSAFFYLRFFVREIKRLLSSLFLPRLNNLKCYISCLLPSGEKVNSVIMKQIAWNATSIFILGVSSQKQSNKQKCTPRICLICSSAARLDEMLGNAYMEIQKRLFFFSEMCCQA